MNEPESSREPASMEVTQITENVPEDLADIIRQIDAIRQDLPRLPAERKLSELIGVKRHQIRRALAAMRDTGALPQSTRRARRSGAADGISDYVHNTNPVEVVELRLMIEPTLARLAALRATPAKIEEMRQAVAAQSAPNGMRDLHRLIAEASGNALAAELYGLVRRIDADAKLNMPRDYMMSLDVESDTCEHTAIVEAIANRAPDQAEEAMRKHLMAFHRYLMMGPS